MSGGHEYDGVGPEDAFRQAMQKAGISTGSSIVADGKLHRFHVDGDSSGTANGWYVLYNGAVPAGIFGCWKRGIKEIWCSKNRSQLTRKEKEEYKSCCESFKKLHRMERKRMQTEARRKAEKVWDMSSEVSIHGYLGQKKVKAFGIRKHGSSLVVPMRDGDAVLHSLQFIGENGKKLFLSGGRVKGTFHLIGKPNGRIFVAEGYATAATIHDVTGAAVAVAFYAGNLKPVAEELRRRFGDLQLILAADNDVRTDGNPGITKAQEAAAAVGGLVAVPEFRDETSNGSDFNDLFRLEGTDRVRELLSEAKEPERSLDDTLAELAQLSDVEYDRRRTAEAKRFGIRVPTLDKEVENRRELKGAQGTGGGTQVQFEEVEPWPGPVDGGVLLTSISNTLRKYVVLPEGAADAEALWVLFTYAHDAFVTSPILAIVSPVLRCGKTTHLSVLDGLVNKPLSASSVTTAALFRSIELWSPTLLVDELDTFIHKSDDLRGVLNSGHKKRTANFVRCVGDDNEPRNFRTWAPKALALIGKMHTTLTDRSITILMARKLPGDRVTRLRNQEAADLLELKRKCARWATDHQAALMKEEPELPVGLNDRAKDNWEPLLAIAEQAGGNWPQRALTSIWALERDDMESESCSIILLEDIRALFERGGPSFLPSADILKALEAMEERPWPEFRRGKAITARQLVHLLRPFDIKPKQKRDGKDVIRGYTKDSFTDVFARYLAAGSVTPLQTASEAGSSVVRSVTDTKAVTDGIRSEPAYQAGCNAVTDETKEIIRI